MLSALVSLAIVTTITNPFHQHTGLLWVRDKCLVSNTHNNVAECPLNVIFDLITLVPIVESS